VGRSLPRCLSHCFFSFSQGRKIVWYAAIFGTVLAVSRALITEEHKVFCPEAAMEAVVKHTHHFPRHWRNRCHLKAVQAEFEQLFKYKAALFVEEMLAVLVTPAVLWFSLPASAGAILAFVRDFSVRVEGVGDVCSLAVFDFEHHGNARYASPVDAPKPRRSSQGKMEKSFLSFQATYEGSYAPDPRGRDMLHNLSSYAQEEEQQDVAAAAAAGRARAGAAGTTAGANSWLAATLRLPEADPMAMSGLLTEQRQAMSLRSHAALQRFLAHPPGGGGGGGSSVSPGPWMPPSVGATARDTYGEDDDHL
jgi:hypothetical protein